MADLCRQCSIDVCGMDHGDLRGKTSPVDWQARTAAVVLCEVCGPIQVDPDGNCISPDCLRAGHNMPGPDDYDDDLAPPQFAGPGLVIGWVVMALAIWTGAIWLTIWGLEWTWSVLFQ